MFSASWRRPAARRMQAAAPAVPCLPCHRPLSSAPTRPLSACLRVGGHARETCAAVAAVPGVPGRGPGPADPALDRARPRRRARLPAGPGADAVALTFRRAWVVPTIEQALDGAAMLLSGAAGTRTSNSRHAPSCCTRAALGGGAGPLDRLRRALSARRPCSGCCRPRSGSRRQAYVLARATFPGQVVSLQPNLHLREQVERLAPCPDPQRRQQVLLLPEPVDRPGWRRAGRRTGAGLPAGECRLSGPA